MNLTCQKTKYNFFAFVNVSSVLSRTLYVNNVPSHARLEELERLLAPLGTLVKCDKINPAGTNGSSTGTQEEAPAEQTNHQAVEVVYETSEEAEK